MTELLAAERSFGMLVVAPLFAAGLVVSLAPDIVLGSWFVDIEELVPAGIATEVLGGSGAAATTWKGPSTSDP